jgi:lysophospholipase L1-like esterase
LAPRLRWKKFTSDNPLSIRLLRSVVLLCGFAVGSIISYKVFHRTFHYDLGFSRLEFRSAFLLAASLAVLYVVEPRFWHLILGSDEKLLSRRFAFHAWPIILFIPAGLLWNAFENSVVLLPILLMFFNRFSCALRCRSVETTWPLYTSSARYAASLAAVAVALTLMTVNAAEFVLGAYFLWLFSLILLPAEIRRAVVIESSILAAPFLAATVLLTRTGSEADNFLLIAAFVFVGGVFMLCSLRKQRARFYAPIMWAAVILALTTMEFAVRQTGYDEYLRPRQVGKNMKTDDLLFYIPKDLFPGVNELYVHAMRFRSGKVNVQKSPGVSRIICMGGSSTWGSGVGDNETWPAFLELMVREKGIEAQIINAGISGYTSFQVMIFIREYLLRYNPDAFILYVGHNDMAHSFGPYSERELWEMMHGQRGRYGQAITAIQKQLSQVRLYNAVRIVVVGAKRAWHSDEEVSASRPNEFLANIREIHQMLQPRGIHLILMAEAMQLDDLDYHSGMRELARRLNIPFNDIYADFNLRPDVERLFLDSVHLTPEGNRLVAAHAWDLLEKAGVMP